jgi:hypothetical protein
MFDYSLSRIPNRLVLGAAMVVAAAWVPSLVTTAAPADRATARNAPARHHTHRARPDVPFSIARIYWEFNSSANDLGVHVKLDAEDWKRVRIEAPCGNSLFEVKGKGPYQNLGMTELFFEGAEPSLSQVPLADLLGMFPEGDYAFEGRTVDGQELESEVPFSHAIPAGPTIAAALGGTRLVISWDEVTGPPPGFPQRPIAIAGYQVIVGKFEVTLPASARSVTVPPEFVASLPAGVNQYEVLAIEQNGNQSITEGTFVK